MKRLFTLCLAVLLLLSACGQAPRQEAGVPQETEENIFTVPETLPAESESPSTAPEGDAAAEATDPRPTYSPEEVAAMEAEFIRPLEEKVRAEAEADAKGEPLPAEGMSYGFEVNEYTYQGGELPLKLRINTNLCSQVGGGILLFLDGRPQPYRTEEEPEYRYMHTFYPEDNVDTVYTVYIRPVAGKARETLEARTICLVWPDYFPTELNMGSAYTGTGGGALIYFECDAEPVELPRSSAEVLSCEAQFADMKTYELPNRTDAVWANPSTYNYHINQTEPIELEIDIKTLIPSRCGLIIYVDNQPVSLTDENALLLDIPAAQKGKIKLRLTLPEFDGSSVIYGYLVARDQLVNGLGAGADFDWCRLYQLFYSDAESHDDMMGWLYRE